MITDKYFVDIFIYWYNIKTHANKLKKTNDKTKLRGKVFKFVIRTFSFKCKWPACLPTASDQLAMWRFLHPLFDGRPWPRESAHCCSATLSVNGPGPLDCFWIIYLFIVAYLILNDPLPLLLGYCAQLVTDYMRIYFNTCDKVLYLQLYAGEIWNDVSNSITSTTSI